MRKVIPTIFIRADHFFKHGYTEAEGFPRAGFRLPDDVGPFERHGQSESLDRKGVRDPCIAQSGDDRLAHAKIGERAFGFVRAVDRRVIDSR